MEAAHTAVVRERRQDREFELLAPARAGEWQSGVKRALDVTGAATFLLLFLPLLLAVAALALALQGRPLLYGHARIVDDPPQELLSRLTVPGYRGQAERVILIDVVAYDWNCPQHLTPRYDAAHFERALAPLQARIRELESELNALRPPG